MMFPSIYLFPMVNFLTPGFSFAELDGYSHATAEKVGSRIVLAWITKHFILFPQQYYLIV